MYSWRAISKRYAPSVAGRPRPVTATSTCPRPITAARQWRSETELGRPFEHAVALRTDRRRLSVAGVHDGLVGQCQQHVADRAQDRRLVAVAAPRRAWAA